VLSENVVYVGVSGFVTKRYINHDLENEVEKLNSWKPIELGLVRMKLFLGSKP
jgi:hypothetical protein